MKYIRIAIAVSVAAVMIGLAAAPGAMARNTHHDPKAKNIIFMVPDGMGMSYVTATRIFKNGPNGDRLSFETLPHIGYQRTHSKNSTVTDSAAAASAWASGAKYNNGEISCHDDDFNGACDTRTTVPTILEIAKKRGKATGLVVTSDITHATPAAFGSHVHNRKCEEEIAIQYLTTGIDVLLGGGIAKNRRHCLLPPSGADYLAVIKADATAKGYIIVDTESAMNGAVASGAGKMIGLFKAGGKTPERFRVDGTPYPPKEPTLPEMTAAALALMEDNRNVFCLLVEGSQIDWAGHANDIDYLLGETLAFDETVRVVKDWIAAMPLRRQDTLLIVVSDHETGGLMIRGPDGTLTAKGDIIHATWTSTDHNAQDTVIWSQGPGSQRLNRAVDNTDLYEVMVDVIE